MNVWQGLLVSLGATAMSGFLTHTHLEKGEMFMSLFWGLWTIFTLGCVLYVLWYAYRIYRETNVQTLIGGRK